MNDPSHPPISPDPPRTWSVWRVDDNGNVFLVQGRLSQEEANRLAAELEARKHKQMYWVEQEPAGA